MGNQQTEPYEKHEAMGNVGSFLSISPDDLQQNNNTNKLNLSETSSACPSKMGEGRNGPSHCPLPKVLVQSEVESLKLNRSQLNEEYLPIVALPEDIPFESQNPNMQTNLRVSTKPKHKSSPSVLSPQELQTAYAELLITFSDP